MKVYFGVRFLGSHKNIKENFKGLLFVTHFLPTGLNHATALSTVVAFQFVNY